MFTESENSSNFVCSKTNLILKDIKWHRSAAACKDGLVPLYGMAQSDPSPSEMTHLKEGKQRHDYSSDSIQMHLSNIETYYSNRLNALENTTNNLLLRSGFDDQ